MNKLTSPPLKGVATAMAIASLAMLQMPAGAQESDRVEAVTALSMINHAMGNNCCDPAAYEIRGDIYAQLGLTSRSEQDYKTAQRLSASAPVLTASR